ncbi:MAG: diphthine synthase [Candidatus Woesearchaeota archaeon]
MALYLIGAGLHDEKDITIRGMELLKNSHEIFLEGYTSLSSINLKNLEVACGRRIRIAERELLEQDSKMIIELAKKQNISILVIGDPLSATTHIELLKEAEALGVKTEVIGNASVLTAVGITGLQLYKFGKTASIPFPDDRYTIETPYEVLRENLSIKAHTLMLLDLNPKENRFLTANEAIMEMLKIENKRREGIFTEKTKILVCARLGSPNFLIRSGEAGRLMKEEFGNPPHCIIVPAELHFVEEECLRRWEK